MPWPVSRGTSRIGKLTPCVSWLSAVPLSFMGLFVPQWSQCLLLLCCSVLHSSPPCWASQSSTSKHCCMQFMNAGLHHEPVERPACCLQHGQPQVPAGELQA